MPNDKSGVNSSQGHKGAAELIRRALSCIGALFVAWLALYLLDIGCVFRLMTGIPCPGCGMTRAWLAALRLDFATAFAYHPLFWVVPIAFVLAFVREEVTSSKLKRGIDIALLLCVCWSSPYGSCASSIRQMPVYSLAAMRPPESPTISSTSKPHAGSPSFALTCRNGGRARKAVDT
ncbi:MAG: DUF2752 domain-containing protein [Collinsella sp.]